jgi:hypothetical protein
MNNIQPRDNRELDCRKLKLGVEAADSFSFRQNYFALVYHSRNHDNSNIHQWSHFPGDSWGKFLFLLILRAFPHTRRPLLGDAMAKTLSTPIF